MYELLISLDPQRDFIFDSYDLVRPYWRCYYANTDAIIYVVDSADRDRISTSKEELMAMLEVCTGFAVEKIIIVYLFVY
jgi:hypothetical protein